MSQTNELPPLPVAVREAIDAYWDHAHTEGKTGMPNGSAANAILSELVGAIRDYARAAIAAQAPALEIAQKNAVFLADQLVKQSDDFEQAAQAGQSEPVAWTDPKNIEFLRQYKNGGVVVFLNQEKAGQVPVYAHQAPVRQPLTDLMRDQMKEAADSLEMRGAFVDGWKSAEAAHGIIAQGDTQ